MEIFEVIAELGFTITAVLAGGAFIIILLKYIKPDVRRMSAADGKEDARKD